MENRLKVASCAGIAEYQVSKSAPIQFAILARYAAAKPLEHFRKPMFARSDHSAGRRIGVDDRNAKFTESLGNGAFSAGDASCEADAQAAGHCLMLEARHA
jgi:hypothetical protein